MPSKKKVHFQKMSSVTLDPVEYLQTFSYLMRNEMQNETIRKRIEGSKWDIHYFGYFCFVLYVIFSKIHSPFLKLSIVTFQLRNYCFSEIYCKTSSLPIKLLENSFQLFWNRALWFKHSVETPISQCFIPKNCIYKRLTPSSTDHFFICSPYFCSSCLNLVGTTKADAHKNRLLH